MSLRFYYKRRKTVPRNPSVALVGDNLDEVNGIALHSRTLVRTLRKSNHNVYLIGIAFHSKKPRFESKKGFIFMMPGRCSMERPGYKGSEDAVPRLALMIRLLRRYPIDLMEFETPSIGVLLALIVAKVAGIRTISHYRTDVISYTRMLLSNKLGVWVLHLFVKGIVRFSDQVIVPSNAFKPKVEYLGVPAHKIHKLPRGVDLKFFHPDKKNTHSWEELGLFKNGIRLLYVGRVSREKNLELLARAFINLEDLIPDICLTVVGDGPFLEPMKSLFKPDDRVHFTGVLRGQALSGVIAAADIMVFPSTTDTFGNTVIEALASGIPCIVSDQGGPQEIIEHNKSGLRFLTAIPGQLEECIRTLAEDTQKLASFKLEARQRSLNFTHAHSADKFWEFYCLQTQGN